MARQCNSRLPGSVVCNFPFSSFGQRPRGRKRDSYGSRTATRSSSDQLDSEVSHACANVPIKARMSTWCRTDALSKPRESPIQATQICSNMLQATQPAGVYRDIFQQSKASYCMRSYTEWMTKKANHIEYMCICFPNCS